jgi:hypothetical protein
VRFARCARFHHGEGAVCGVGAPGRKGSRRGRTHTPKTLDARCIAHSLEHGRARETHPDRAATALVGAGVMDTGSGGSVQENTGSIAAMRRARILSSAAITVKSFSLPDRTGPR